MTQLVGGDAGWQRKLTALGEQFVGTRDDRADDALAGVVLVAQRAALGREREIIGLGPGRGQLANRELVPKDWQQVDVAQPGGGL